MRRGHRRLVSGMTAAALALTAALTTAVGTHAVERLEWTVAPGFPIVFNEATVTVETAVVPAEDAHTIEPYPIQRINIVNVSPHTRHFSFGIDIETQSVIEPLWNADTLGGLEGGASLSPLVVTLGPGEQLAETPGHLLYYGISIDVPGIPIFPGRTAVVYELSGDPALDPEVTATELGRVTSPGGFVPVDLDGERTPDGTAPAGLPLTVLGPADGDVELSPGAMASVTASRLPPNLDVELWLAPSADFFSFIAGGSRLPTGSYHVGSARTAPDGTLDTAFQVPAAADFESAYRVFAGVPESHLWPAGTYRAFEIAPPSESDAAAAAWSDTSATLDLGPTDVTFAFPKGTGGTWTGSVSTTGPAVDGFSSAGGAPRYYNLDTTATTTEPVTLCVTYSVEEYPGDPPRLFHYVPTASEGAYRWTDITSDPLPGRVCGETSTFSAFSLGHPIEDGSAVPPAVGVLHSDNGWDTGLLDGDYNIVMDLVSGENARIVRLLENGEVVAQQSLTLDSPNPQRATFPLSGRPNATYVYTAELENSRGITTTKPLSMEVVDANPGRPVLSATTPRRGAFTVTASMRWGTNATSYRFLQNGVEVMAGPLIAASPNPQFATLSRTGLARGTYTYTVEFAGDAGMTSSAPLTVTVE
jgi:hypothetical protein